MGGYTLSNQDTRRAAAEQLVLRIKNTRDERALLIALDALQQARTEGSKCTWVYDEYHDCYDTGCHEAYCLIDGTLDENRHRYCPYCGGQIEARAQEGGS